MAYDFLFSSSFNSIAIKFSLSLIVSFISLFNTNSNMKYNFFVVS